MKLIIKSSGRNVSVRFRFVSFLFSRFVLCFIYKDTQLKQTQLKQTSVNMADNLTAMLMSCDELPD